MATSGTAAFNPDIAEICEEAFERCGLEMRSGYDLRTARRSLNIMSAEWSNRWLNLWTVAEGTLSITAGTATYTLPSDTIDSKLGFNFSYFVTSLYAFKASSSVA